MSLRGLFAAVFLLASVSLGGMAHAGSADAAAARLATLERQQRELQAERQALATELTRTREALAAASGNTEAEQAELEAAQAALEQARAQHQASPGDETASRLQQAEFRVVLAERRLNRARAEASGGLDRELAELERRDQQAAQRLAELATAITGQRNQVTQRRRAEQAENQAEALARSRREAEAARAEIERLRQLLEQREAAEEAVAAEQQSAAAVDEAAADAALDEGLPPITLVERGTGDNAGDNATAGNGAALRPLADPDAVVASLQQLERRLANTPRGRNQPMVNRVMYIRAANAGPDADSDSVRLRPLGRQHYRGESSMRSGSYELSVGFQRWNVDIPSRDNGATYIFLFSEDADSEQPLILYNRALESGTGS